jgi:hypothetical protein
VHDLALGAALHEARQRHHQLDLELVGDLGGRGFADDLVEHVAAVELAGDVAFGEAPRQHPRFGVVVLERVVGGSTHPARTEPHRGGSPLGVASEHLDLLEIARPLGVAIEVEQDLEHPLGRSRDGGLLGDAIRHGAEATCAPGPHGAGTSRGATPTR